MTHTADLVQDPVSSKWHAIFQGRSIISSQDPKYVESVIRRGLNATAKACGITSVRTLTNITYTELLQNPLASEVGSMMNPSVDRPVFSIDERFQFLSDYTEMTIHGTAVALVVSGRGGLGKTYTVKSVIADTGLTYTHDFEAPLVPKPKKESEYDEDIDGEDEEDLIPDPNWVNPGQVHYIKGYSSANALYKTLFDNNGKLIVFDDCDSIQKDQNALNILKGALDSSEERWIAWNTGRKPKGTPAMFKFTGRVIFITNIKMEFLDENLLSRSLKVDLSMTNEEKITRMRHIISVSAFEPNIAMECKIDAVDFIEEHMSMAANLSLRTLLDTIKFRVENKPNWKRQALYSMSAGF